MITSVTLTAGRRTDGARRRHRQAPGGDSELRQHRHPVQRQDRHPDERRDAASTRSSTRAARPSDRRCSLAYVNSRLGNRHPQPAGPGDPRARRSSTSAPTARSTRCPSTSSGGGCRLSSSRRTPAGAADAHHQRRARSDPVAVAGRRARPVKPAPLDDARRGTRVGALPARCRADGLRVLAVAYRGCRIAPPYSRADERDLVLAGFLSFADPAAAGRRARRSRSSSATA